MKTGFSWGLLQVDMFTENVLNCEMKVLIGGKTAVGDRERGEVDTYLRRCTYEI